MSRRSIRKQQIEAVHDLLDRPAFVIYPFTRPDHSGRGLPGKLVEHYRVVDNFTRLTPDASAEMPITATHFDYVTSDREHAKFVARSKNAEAIVDAVRELKTKC